MKALLPVAQAWIAVCVGRPTARAMLDSFVPELTAALDALVDEVALDDAEIWKAWTGRDDGQVHR